MPKKFPEGSRVFVVDPMLATGMYIDTGLSQSSLILNFVYWPNPMHAVSHTMELAKTLGAVNILHCVNILFSLPRWFGI